MIYFFFVIDLSTEGSPISGSRWLSLGLHEKKLTRYIE